MYLFGLSNVLEKNVRRIKMGSFSLYSNMYAMKTRGRVLTYEKNECTVEEVVHALCRLLLIGEYRERGIR